MAALVVVPSPAIAQGDVEHAIGPEVEGATVVVVLGLIDSEQFAPAGWIAEVGISISNSPFGNHALVGAAVGHVGVGEVRGAVDGFGGVGVEGPVGSELRMECEAEEAPFVVGARTAEAQGNQAIGNIQELGAGAVAGYAPDEAGLLENKDSARAVVGEGGTEGYGEPVGDDLQADVHVAGRDRFGYGIAEGLEVDAFCTVDLTASPEPSQAHCDHDSDAHGDVPSSHLRILQGWFPGKRRLKISVKFRVFPWSAKE